MTKASNINGFKENLGNSIKKIPWSEEVKQSYKRSLFREIVVHPDYQQLKKEYLDDKKTEKAREKLFYEVFSQEKESNPSLTEEEFRELFFEITPEDLLNKRHMTIKDKEGMSKAIKFLEKNGELTQDALKRLNSIVYTTEYISIGQQKRPREDVSAKPDGENIYQHNSTTYFKWNTKTIMGQKAILAQKNMDIPDEHDYASLFYATSGSVRDGNVAPLILGMSMSKFCYSDGFVNNEEERGYYWTLSSSSRNNHKKIFSYGKNEGHIADMDENYACTIRPIFK